MSNVPNSPEPVATRAHLAKAVRYIVDANPAEALALDPASSYPNWIPDAWFNALQTTFPNLTAERLLLAGQLAATSHPGILLWNLAEEIRKLDPMWHRNPSGSWWYAGHLDGANA